MIYVLMGIMVLEMAGLFVLAVRQVKLESRYEHLFDILAKHAAEHKKHEAEIEDKEEEIAGRIAQQIEKRWDDGLSKMLAWNPFDKNESEGG